MSTNQVKCKNCEQSFNDEFQFCPHCGQKANDELTISVLFYNTISNYFSFDARFFKSFIPLLFKPGYLAKEFIKGKRLLYLHPAQMYLFISVVFFFIFSFTVREQKELINEGFSKSFDTSKATIIDSIVVKELDSIERIKIRETLESTMLFSGISQKEIDSIVSLEVLPKQNNISLGSFQVELDSLIEINAPDKEIYKSWGLEKNDGWFKRTVYQQGLKFYKGKDAGNIWSEFVDTIPIALFFLLPIFAFVLKIFNRKRGTYAHHLVFSFYYFSFIFTLFSIVFAITLMFEFSAWIDFLILLLCFVYFFIALKKFYRQGWIWSFVKACFFAMVFTPIVLLSAILIGFLAFMIY